MRGCEPCHTPSLSPGNVLDSGANVAGDISIPNFSEEHEMEEVDVSESCDIM